MKDLKHLFYFENLLEDADNELIKQAQDEYEQLMRNKTPKSRRK